MGVAGRDIQYGYGLVNAKRAVDLATAYATNRIPQTVNREPYATEGRTIIVRTGAGLPTWLDNADVFDGSGRRVLVRGRTAERLELAPGTYFARLAGRTKDKGPGTRSETTCRLLVLD